MTPRLLTPADVPQCLELSAEAGWNQTHRDWMRLLTLAPDGCFGIDADGRVAATATLVCYGNVLAWIGMVLVRKSHRGRGFARTLMKQTLDVAAAKRIACVKLDATDLGEPVYAKLGFEPEVGVERWQRAGVSEPRPSGSGGRLTVPAHLQTLDFQSFGADRSALLFLLGLEPGSLSDERGYCLVRPGAHATFIGPGLSAEAHRGHALVAEILARHPGETVFWDRFSRNAALEPDLGFERARSLLRMRKGKPVDYDPARQFALAGFELG